MLRKKLEELKNIFAEMEKALIAYSGGIDSTLVAKVAYDVLGDKALAITAVSPSLLPEDLEDARIQAAVIGISHEEVKTHEMENQNYTSNPINRCYFCKSELHDTLKPLALKKGYSYVVDGVNAEDLRDYRPGIQAAKERGARSPLAEVGMSKFEVRQLAKDLDLPWWDKPAQPCLSSRFPYGHEITSERLKMVEKAEEYLKECGLSEVRVRCQGSTARIEIPQNELKHFFDKYNFSELVQYFSNLGFNCTSLDLEGLISGKLNR